MTDLYLAAFAAIAGSLAVPAADAWIVQEAEEEALRQTVEQADIADGQSILELGCGWGSLSLWMARHFRIRIPLCSANTSRAKPASADEESACGHLGDEFVRPADAVRSHRLRRDVRPHTDWRESMSRVRSWLKPGGRFVMHTGGMMPSHHLIRQYADLLEVEKECRWSGTHYQRTAEDWLADFDLRREEIEEALQHVHGGETAL